MLIWSLYLIFLHADEIVSGIPGRISFRQHSVLVVLLIKRRKSKVLMFCCLFYKHLVNQLEDKLLLLRHQKRGRGGDISQSGIKGAFSSSLHWRGVFPPHLFLGGVVKEQRQNWGELFLIYLLSFPFGHFQRLKEPSWL